MPKIKRVIRKTRKYLMDDEWLQHQFKTLKRQFFFDILIPVTCEFGKPNKDDGDHPFFFGYYCSGSQTITVNEAFRGFTNTAIETLLHEMIHVKLVAQGYRGDHGMRFQAEIVRLFEAGAYEGLL